MKHILRLLALLTLTISLTACPSAIDEASLALLKDLEAPIITITSPADYSEYATVIRLSGNIEDDSIGHLPEGASITVAYSIAGTSINGSIAADSIDGTFATTIDASNLEGSRIIELTTSDINGNEATAVVNIVKPEAGDISNFTVTPGNKEATISWDAVEGAESYSIYESFSNQTADISDPAVTSYSWKNLVNNGLYNFRLTANIPESLGDDAVSDSITTMPLSPDFFTPSIDANSFDSITVSWRASENVEKYLVERKKGIDGNWHMRRLLSETSFIDDEVERGADYYYRVTPSEYPDIASKDACGQNAYYTTKLLGGYALKYLSDVDVERSYAYAVSSEGLYCVDISNPATPVVSGSLDTVKGSYITVDDNYAYSVYNHNLYITDVSTPAAPELLSSYNIAENTLYEVIISGDYAYIAGSNGFYIINVENKSAPEPAGSYAGSFTALDISGSYAYLAYGLDGGHAKGLRIIDISTPASLNSLEPFEFEDSDEEYYSSVGLEVEGNFAYVLTRGYGLSKINIETPSAPSLVATADIDADDNDAVSFKLNGDFAYVGFTPSGVVREFNISDAASPAVIREFEVARAGGFDISDGNLYMASYTKGLQIFQDDIPANPVLTDTDSLSGQPFGNGLMVSGEYLYTTDYSGFSIFDIHEPDKPSLLGKYTDSDDWLTRGAFVVGDYAYITGRTKGLQVIDISDKRFPRLTGNYISDITPYDKIIVKGEYAYTNSFGYAFVILNISDPISPELISTTGCKASPKGLAVKGDYVFVGSTGIEVFDITNRKNPQLKKTIDNYGTVYGLASRGNYLYVSDYTQDALCILDITNPEVPVEKGSCGVTNPFEVILDGDYAYLTEINTSRILTSVNITDPTNPMVIGRFAYNGNSRQIDIRSRYAYTMVSGGSGNNLLTIDLAGEE